MRNEVPANPPAATGHGRYPPFAQRRLFPLPVSAVPRTTSYLASTASRSQIAAYVWSTPQVLAALKASGILRSSRSSLTAPINPFQGPFGPSLLPGFRGYLRCRVGGGALARWPPSAAQTVRAVFPHTAFTKTLSSEMQSKESTESSSPARTRRTTWFPVAVASPRFANA